jgi:hypothetical protein
LFSAFILTRGLPVYYSLAPFSFNPHFEKSDNLAMHLLVQLGLDEVMSEMFLVPKIID